MKIQYLGTAAYEGVPSLFCNCEVCRLTREKGGRNIRTRSQALVNDELLLDFPPDTSWHYTKYRFDWNRIGACLITHAHSDHLYPADVEMAAEGYSHNHKPMHFYAGEAGCEKLRRAMEIAGADATLTLVTPGEKFTVIDGKYTVLPLWANHAPETSPVMYAIERDGKRLLYAHDSGVFCEKTWEGLRSFGRFDLVSLDCTGCASKKLPWRDGHMNLYTNLETIARMKEEGMADASTVFVANHFTHNGEDIYDTLAPKTAAHGVITSYDGMELTF